MIWKLRKSFKVPRSTAEVTPNVTIKREKMISEANQLCSIGMHRAVIEETHDDRVAPWSPNCKLLLSIPK